MVILLYSSLTCLGNIDFEEFVLCIYSLSPMSHQTMEEQIQSTEKEFHSNFPVSFDLYDVDGDGRIERNELCQYLAKTLDLLELCGEFFTEQATQQLHNRQKQIQDLKQGKKMEIKSPVGKIVESSRQRSRSLGTKPSFTEVEPVVHRPNSAEGRVDSTEFRGEMLKNVELKKQK